MIRRLLISFVLLFFSFSELYAINNKIALDLARTKQIERIIKRVNAIHELINLNIMQTGFAPANITAITTDYGGVQIDGYSGVQIAFTITNNIVEYQNILSTNEPTIIQSLYQNSVELHPFASFNTVGSDIRMQIPLSAGAISFLNKVQLIESLDTANTVFVSDTEPIAECDIIGEVGNIWYRPDFRGDFVVHVCTQTVGPPAVFQWDVISNKLDIAVFVNTPSNNCTDLDAGGSDPLIPPVGTRAYIPNGATNARECIFNGTTWLIVP